MNTDFTQNIIENEQVWQRLHYLLSHIRKPTVIWIAAEDNAQLIQVFEKIQQTFSTCFQHERHSLLSYKEGSFMRFLQENLSFTYYLSQSLPTVIHLWNIEGLVINDTFTLTPFLESLNFERDTVFKDLPFHLIFWSNTISLKQVQRYALDFIDYLTYTFIFLPETNDKLAHIVAQERILSLSHPTLITPYQEIATDYLTKRDYPKSLEYHLKALQLLKETEPENSLNIANAYNDVAIDYLYLGKHDKALQYNEKDLAIKEKILSEDDPDLAISYNNIASTYKAIGDLKKSLEYHLIAIKIREKILPPEHLDLATSYNNIASTYAAMGYFEISLVYYLKAIKIRKKILSPEHPDLATSYNNIAGTYKDMGDLESSLKYNLKAIKIREKILPSEHPNLAASYNNIAHTYYKLQDVLQSLAYFQKAILIFKKALPYGHSNTKNSINAMWGVLMELKKAGREEEIKDYIQWYEEECKAYLAK